MAIQAVTVGIPVQPLRFLEQEVLVVQIALVILAMHLVPVVAGEKDIMVGLARPIMQVALVLLALAVVLAGLGNCAEQEEDEKPRKERQPQKKQAASRRKAG